MKKLIASIVAVVMCSSAICLFSDCNKKETEDLTTSSSILTTEVLNVEKNETKTKNAVGGGEIVQEKYRQCYYRISYQFAQLVDSQELKTWEEIVLSEDPNETNEMIMKRFVLDFSISRENFDKANLELAKFLYDPYSPLPSMNPKDYINQEMFELYNADIIYTFDDRIINEYYLSGEYPFIYESDYEQAVADGTYQTRTTDWIDIEQMEADIIAKYGEAEIITETPSYEETTENSTVTE